MGGRYSSSASNIGSASCVGITASNLPLDIPPGTEGQAVFDALIQNANYTFTWDTGDASGTFDIFSGADSDCVSVCDCSTSSPASPGVWLGILGALFLLLRRRHAAHPRR